MAYLKNDRRGRMKIDPVFLLEGFPLEDGAVIYANSLAVVTDAAEIGRIEDHNDATAKAVVFSDERLQMPEEGKAYDFNGLNARSHVDGINEANFEILSHVTVLLDAVGLTVGNVGDLVYAVDDHTVEVSADPDTEARPAVGRIDKVFSPTLAFVYIPGLKRQ